VTVGIAAKCRTTNLADTLICVADTEFSHGFTSSGRHFKFQTLGGKWLAMLAANDLQDAEDLLDEINGLLAADASNRDSAHSMKNVLSLARDQVRAHIAGRALPPGLSLQEYLLNGKANLPDWAYTEIWNALKRSRLQCELLVVGVDTAHYVHLLSVGEDSPRSHDRESFYAIGSGKLIASAILSACDQSEYDDWRLTTYRLYCAKKCSERAEGVGEETVMLCATSDGLWTIAGEVLEPLYGIYGPLPVTTQQPALIASLATLALKKEDPSIDWRSSKKSLLPGSVPLEPEVRK
jgi:hypothetical protein